MTHSETNYDLALVFLTYDSVFRDIAEGLASKGLKVIVFAPNREYKNTDICHSSEQVNDTLRIERVAVPRFDKNNLLWKLALYYLFSKKTGKELSKINAKLYMSTLMPVLVPYVVFQIARKKTAPFILLLEDLVPDTWIRRKRFSKNNPFVRFFGNQTRTLLLGSEKVIVIGRDMKDYIQEDYGVPEGKISFISNWAKLAANGSQPKPQQREGSFKVLYGGTIGEAQNLEPLIEAADILSEQDPEVEIEIIGSGMKKKALENMAKSRGINNISFYDLLPEPEYRDVMDQASVLVISLREESKGMSVPSKTYSCLAAGKPLLAIVPEGSEIHLEIQEDGYGIFCPPSNPKAIARAILDLKTDKGLYENCSKNALKAHRLKYNDKVALEKYFEVVEDTLERKVGS